MLITKLDIKRAVEKSRRPHFDGFEYADKITTLDLEKFSKYIAFGVQKEKIAAVMYANLFKTCKKGFVLTTEKFYFSGNYYIIGDNGTTFIDITDLRGVDYNRNNQYNVVTFFFDNRKEIEFYAAGDAKTVFEFFCSIITIKNGDRKSFNEFSKQESIINNVNPKNLPADYVPPKKESKPVKTFTEENFYEIKVFIAPYTLGEDENAEYHPPFMKVFRFNNYYFVAVGRCQIKAHTNYSPTAYGYNYTLINLVTGQASEFTVLNSSNYDQCHYYNVPQEGYCLDSTYIKDKCVYIYKTTARITPQSTEATICVSEGGANVIDLKTGEKVRIHNVQLMDRRIRLPQKNECVFAVKYNGKYYMIHNIAPGLEENYLKKIFLKDN